MRIAINQISLNPRAIAGLLATIAVLLVLASIGGQFLRLVLGAESPRAVVALFYVDHEQNIPTYFSVLLMLFSSLLLAIIAVLNRKQKIPHVSKWAMLSFGFLFMASDEAFQLHERLDTPVSALLGNSHLGVFYFSWVIPGIALVLVLGLAFLKFLLHLPPAERFRVLMAATLYLGGTIGVELLGGRYAELHGVQNWTYSLIVTLEESLEMAGLIVFIWALLKYCANNYKQVQFRFDV